MFKEETHLPLAMAQAMTKAAGPSANAVNASIVTMKDSRQAYLRMMLTGARISTQGISTEYQSKG